MRSYHCFCIIKTSITRRCFCIAKNRTFHVKSNVCLKCEFTFVWFIEFFRTWIQHSSRKQWMWSYHYFCLHNKTSVTRRYFCIIKNRTFHVKSNVCLKMECTFAWFVEFFRTWIQRASQKQRMRSYHCFCIKKIRNAPIFFHNKNSDFPCQKQYMFKELVYICTICWNFSHLHTACNSITMDAIIPALKHRIPSELRS